MCRSQVHIVDANAVEFDLEKRALQVVMMMPFIISNRDLTYKRGRVSLFRRPMRHSGQLGDLSDAVFTGGFLQSDDVRADLPNDIRNPLLAANAAKADVVTHQA